MLELNGINISGVVSCVPSQREKNIDFFTGDDTAFQGFLKHVGVEERRTSGGQLTTSDLCVAAAKELMNSLNWVIEDIDILIFVSQSQDYNTPATSYWIQKELGLRENTFLLDINLGCTGWVTGLHTLSSLMIQHGLNRGLLLCGETNILTDTDHMESYLLMGDAGTATGIELTGDTTSQMLFDFANYGQDFDTIISRESKARYIQEKGFTQVKQGLNLNTTMDGEKILMFTLKRVIPRLKAFLSHIKEASRTAEWDYLFLHQANKMFNEQIIRKLNVPNQKVPFSLQHFGNTSSASIPLTMCTLQDGNALANKRVVCASFGVGLSIACLSVILCENFKSKLIEI